MATTHEIAYGLRSLDVEVLAFDRTTRTISWRLEYEREFNEHHRLIACGCYEKTLAKITMDDGAIIEAALWEIIDKKEQHQ